MPRVLILTGDGTESLEVMYPFQRFQEEGYDVDIAASSKKVLETVLHDLNRGLTTPGYRIEAPIAFKDVRPEEYVAVVIPGERAPEYIRNDPDFVIFFRPKNPSLKFVMHRSL